MAFSTDRPRQSDAPNLSQLGQAAELLAAHGRDDLAMQVVEAIFALAARETPAAAGISRAAA